jgi:hypothetical protein
MVLVGCMSLAMSMGACSRISRHISGAVPTRKGTLVITPASAAAGTAFSLAAGGFLPGEAMTFEVDIPGRPPFVGPAHTADPGGRVSATYTPLANDPPGTYRIKAVGSRGTRAQSTMHVGGTTTSTR